MKLQTLLITTFALTLSFSTAQENGAKSATTPTVVKGDNNSDKIKDGGVDPYEEVRKAEYYKAALRIHGGVDPYKEGRKLERSKDADSVSPLTELVPPLAPSASGGSPQMREQEKSANHETLSFCYEDFSLPMEMMADIQQKHLTDAALYEYIRKSLGTDPEKDPVRREIFVILRAKSGFSATAENYVTTTDPDSKGTSRVGYRINLEYSASDKIDLRFNLNNTVAPDSSNGAADGAEADKPLNYTESIEATVALSDHTPYLIGTVNRAASSKPGSGSAKRVILGFITASPVK